MMARGRTQPKKQCDRCGVLRLLSEGRQVGDYWVCFWHPNFVPYDVADAEKWITVKTKPIEKARPFQVIDSFEMQDGRILSFVERFLDVGQVIHESTGASQRTEIAKGAAWAGIYAYSIIAEARRPYPMIRACQALLRRAAEKLMAYMAKGPNNSSDSSLSEWGGFERPLAASLTGKEYDVQVSAAAGLALLRAYQVHGTALFREGAKACAWFCRGAQCGDKTADGYATSDAAGTIRYHYGAVCSSFRRGGAATWVPDNYYRPEGLLTLEFWRAYSAQFGDETIGSATVTADFTSSREATISTAISELRSFWVNGVAGADGVVKTGLSPTTPFDGFSSYAESSADRSFLWPSLPTTGYGAWIYIPDGGANYRIEANSFALGLRGLRASDGDSAQVAALHDWLTGFTANASFAIDFPGSVENATYIRYRDSVPYGDFSPKTAPPTQLLVREWDGASYASVSKPYASLYDLSAVGLTAAIYSSRQRAAFSDLKSALGVARTRNDAEALNIDTMGIAGFSLQPFSAWSNSVASSRVSTVWRAAQVGLIYREAPLSFAARGN